MAHDQNTRGWSGCSADFALLCRVKKFHSVEEFHTLTIETAIRFARIRIAPSDREDFVQDAHMTAYLKLAQFMPALSPYKYWLWTFVCQGLRRDRVRDLRKGPRPMSSVVGFAQAEDIALAIAGQLDPAGELPPSLQSEEVLEVVRAVWRLSREERDLLFAIVVLGLSAKGAARYVGLDPTTAGRRLDEARNVLRAYFLQGSKPSTPPSSL